MSFQAWFNNHASHVPRTLFSRRMKLITGQWLDKHAMFVTKALKRSLQGLLPCREHSPPPPPVCDTGAVEDTTRMAWVTL